MGSEFSASFSSYFLILFYTDVFLLPVGAVAVLMFTYRVIDATDDVLFAYFMNRKHYKRGKYLPYYLWLSLPFALFSALMYYTPDISDAWKFVYAFATLLAWEMADTILGTATKALLPFISRDKRERTQLNSVGIVFAVGAFLIVSSSGMNLVALLGGGDQQRGFFMTMLLFGLLSVPMSLAGYFGIKERHLTQKKKIPPRQILHCVLQNRRMLLFLGVYLFYWAGNSFKNQMTIYYVSYNMGRPDAVSSMLLAGVLASFAVQPFIPWIAKHMASGQSMSIGIWGSAASAAAMLCAGQSMPLLIAGNVLFGLFSAVPANLAFTVVADFVDETLARHDANLSDIFYTTLSVSGKIGMAVASGLCPLVFGWTGYRPEAAAQGAVALLGIKGLFLGGTALMLAISGALMLRFWRTERR
jgi:GPH family glycoside/pentoside/hexuronide:cation symporter